MAKSSAVSGFTCGVCGETFTNIAKHYDEEPSHRPTVSDEEMNMLRGLLMGDGYLRHQSAHPSIEIGVVEKRYLEDLQQSHPQIFNSIVHEPRGGNASDFYKMKTVPHPQFFEFKNWYASGEKVFPAELDITPTVLKHWYCTDGGLSWPSNSDRSAKARIACESQDLDRVISYFDDTPFNPSIQGSDTIYFNAEDTPKLLGWMGPPPDGFRYKWQWNDKDDYVRKKRTTPVTPEHLSGLSEELVHVARRLESLEPKQKQQERLREHKKESGERTEKELQRRENELRVEFEKEKRELKREVRNKLIRDLYDELSEFDEKQQELVDRFGGVTQTMISEAVDLSQQSISKITD